MRNLLLVLLCLSLAGCTTISRTRTLEKRITGLQEDLSRKDEEIKIKESQLKEKESEIARLRKRLEGLGVF